VGNVLVAASRSGQKIESRTEMETKCILYSASDANRAHHASDGCLSPILEPIREYYKRNSYNAINLSYPLSYYHSSEVKGGAILLNGKAIIIILAELVEKLLLGHDIALQRKSNRRVKLLKSLLSKIKPNLIFAFQATPELCKAAHELNMAVVEPMHGMHVSPNDKIFRSSISGISREALPDAYLAYDGRTHATLSELIGDLSIDVFRIPHPWHVECNDYNSTIIDRKPSSIIFSTYRSIKILVTLQWGYAGERESLSNIIPNGVMHPALEKAIVENQHVLWLLRMHPVQLRTRGYRAHRNFVRSLSERHSNVEWRDATAFPLPIILANVQGHITMTSGSTGEAAIFGVPSLLLCPTLKAGGAHSGWFSELVEEGLVEFGQLRTECITNWISRLSPVQSTSHRIDWQEERQKFATTLDRVLAIYGSSPDGQGRGYAPTTAAKRF
jgi:hypothetical protein